MASRSGSRSGCGGQLDLDRLRGIADRLDDQKVAAKVVQLADDLRLVAEAVQTGTTREALAVVKDEIGLGGAMGLLDSSSAGEGGSSHLDDLEALEQVADLHPDPSDVRALAALGLPPRGDDPAA